VNSARYPVPKIINDDPVFGRNDYTAESKAGGGKQTKGKLARTNRATKKKAWSCPKHFEGSTVAPTAAKLQKEIRKALPFEADC